MATAGDERTRDAVRRAVRYLLTTQQPDRTWETDSKLISTEPTKEKNYIYRYWGTAWATIGLSQALGSGLLVE